MPTVPSLCVSALWMEILSKEVSLTVEWILMLIQKQQPVISAGIRRGCESLRGAIYSNLWALPTWKWASKERRITGKSCEGVHRSPSAHHHFSTSKIIDHLLPKIRTIHKTLLGLNFGFEFMAVLFFCSHPTEWPCEQRLVLNTPAGTHGSGLLWLLSGFYSAQRRMAKHGASSWQTHRRPVPSFALHSAATPKESQLFIYNLMWKSPSSALR